MRPKPRSPPIPCRSNWSSKKETSGWWIYSRPDFAPVVGKFILDGQQARLTQASLETLAVIAYRQPVSRSRVAAVRGVNVDGVIRTLLSRGLIEERGSDEDSTESMESVETVDSPALATPVVPVRDEDTFVSEPVVAEAVIVEEDPPTDPRTGI